nr:hypothetical protein [Ideonella sp.]
MTTRTRPHPAPLAAAIALTAALAGCAATIDSAGIDQRTAMAIGRPAGSFTVVNQVEGTGGRIDYRVRARDGAEFQCYLYAATGFQRVMSFGQTPHSDAICSAMGGAAS